jgi:hypothetical protein
LIIYEKAEQYVASRFAQISKRFLPEGNAPYVTLEYLDAFLIRKRFAKSEVSGEFALDSLRNHMRNKNPCSSLFLKLCVQYPEECLYELESLAAQNSTLPLINLGERSLHKLAVALVNKQKSPEGSLRKAISVLKLGADPRDWGYVAFNTLMKLAQDEDESTRRTKGVKLSGLESQVDLLFELINIANLHILDRAALWIMSGKAESKPLGSDVADYQDVQLLLQKISTVCSDRRDSQGPSRDDMDFILDALAYHSTSSSHLASMILKKCVENSNFRTGWLIASRMTSISKQVFGDVVILCSKAFFASLRKPNAEKLCDLWFSRIEWCVERHVTFINRHPCGLALHVCACRKDFDCCWKWYSAMKEKLVFRLTGYHVSAVLKAASYLSEPDMDKIKVAYSSITSQERNSFTFVPLTRLWENISGTMKADQFGFWNEVCEDILKYLHMQNSGEYKRHVSEEFMFTQESRESLEISGIGPDLQIDKVNGRLSNWCETFAQWKAITSNGAYPDKFVPPQRRHSGKSQSAKNSLGSDRGNRKTDRANANIPLQHESMIINPRYQKVSALYSNSDESSNRRKSDSHKTSTPQNAPRNPPSRSASSQEIIFKKQTRPSPDDKR